MADVTATFDNCIWLVLLPSGWCYCQVAGIIATVNTVHVWQMLLPWWLMECPPLGVVWQML